MLLPNNIVRTINSLGVLGITLILLVAFYIQLVYGELPCPLCLLQRVGFVLVMYGLMLNVIRGLHFKHYGIVILGALFGGSVALRQIALHVVPGTGSYGSAIFGLHPYTWSFLFFAATLLAAALLLLVSHPRCHEQEFVVTKPERMICWLAIIVTGLNVISAFLECGPLICADPPTDYKLL
ncbi:MAG: disulfide bond formation protein B [Pseudomonadota bacterium]